MTPIVHVRQSHKVEGLCRSHEEHGHLAACLQAIYAPATAVAEEQINTCLRELRTADHDRAYDGATSGCSRFLGLASYLLAGAPLEFGRKYDCAWPTAGTLAGRAMEQPWPSLTGARGDKIIITRFFTAFDEARSDWLFRSKVLKGLSALAARCSASNRDGNGFWSTLSDLRSYFEAAASCCDHTTFPSIMHTAVHDLVRIYWQLASSFPNDNGVSSTVCRAALPLLRLVELLYIPNTRVGNGGFNESLRTWQQMLLALNVSTLREHWNDVKADLESVREQVYRLKNKVTDTDKAEFDAILATVPPFCRGETPVGDRRRYTEPDVDRGHNICRLRMGSDTAMHMPGTVVNICAKSATAFYIEVAGLSPIPYRDSALPYYVKDEGKGKRSIVVHQRGAPAREVEHFDVELRCGNFMDTERLVVECVPWRVWPLPVARGGAGLGIVAKARSVPTQDPLWPKWFSFVRHLPHFRPTPQGGPS